MLEQEIQDHEKKLSGKNEESSCLRNLNQRLLEEIKRGRDEKLENQGLKNKVDKLENDEEISCLRDHNQSLLSTN